MAQLQKGMTTVDDAVAILGKPTTRTINSNGETILIYSHVRAQARPETFIPIVGPLVGGADAHASHATLFFGSDGKLKSYTASETAIGRGDNMASGAPRDRVQDQPAQAPSQ